MPPSTARKEREYDNRYRIGVPFVKAPRMVYVVDADTERDAYEFVLQQMTGVGEVDAQLVSSELVRTDETLITDTTQWETSVTPLRQPEPEPEVSAEEIDLDALFDFS